MTHEYLRMLHESYKTSRDDLATIVKQATGLELCTYHQVVHGYANEVYAVEAGSHRSLIVRVRVRSHGHLPFEMEAWAMNQCRDCGIPAPQVFGVIELERGGGTSEAMVLERVLGHVLGAIYDQISLEQRNAVIARLGELLRDMHKIPVGGFGPLEERDDSGTQIWKRHIDTVIASRIKDVTAAIEAGRSPSEAENLLAIVRTLARTDVRRPTLCHGDLSLDHIFVDDELNVTGFIDFGMAQGGPGVIDLAVLLMFHPEIDSS